MSKDNFLFVYGTLKRGFNNHGYLIGSDFVGIFEIEGAKLLDLGYAPGLLLAGLPFDDKARASKVRGELFKVDKKTIERIDALEGHPSLYERQHLCWYEYAPSCSRPVHGYVWKGTHRPDPTIYTSEWTGPKQSETVVTTH